MAEIVIDDKKLKNLVRQTTIETLQAILKDPDFGLELQEWIKERLEKRSKELIPLERIKEKYL